MTYIVPVGIIVFILVRWAVMLKKKSYKEFAVSLLVTVAFLSALYLQAEYHVIPAPDIE